MGVKDRMTGLTVVAVAAIRRALAEREAGAVVGVCCKRLAKETAVDDETHAGTQRVCRRMLPLFKEADAGSWSMLHNARVLLQRR